MKTKLSQLLSRSNIVVSVVCLPAIAVSLSILPKPLGQSNGAADAFMFFVVWTYILVTPILGVMAIIMGNRKTTLIKLNYIVLLIWLAFFIWTTTLTFM